MHLASSKKPEVHQKGSTAQYIEASMHFVPATDRLGVRQAYLNGTTFDSFLLDVMNAVPSSNATANTDNLLASLPGVIEPEGAPPAASAQGN